ncbi:HDOD domain-containing protein [Inhella gelatinilytica]|uniref:HDOD domain-containing protein n=1 Tax=Inhella gelatinilytica TaxID=2795030 RepID=A0A931J155_9BURK|nr:HDOD domain-containing protein [Inhella gelatinilytica]MBH9553456.1 HDOD domain-containing protein [Inhella gelatinilytica]
MVDSSSPSASPPPAPRLLGPFELRRLLGKSERSMVWQVADSRNRQDLLLVLPRHRPVDPGAWLAAARQATRLEHPGLPTPADTGFADGLPYLAYARSLGQTLTEWLVSHKAPTGVEASRWLERLLQALGIVHDAGFTHGDLQPFTVVLGDEGRAFVLGLGLLGAQWEESAEARRRRQGEALEDVLCVGLLANRLVGGRAPLECTDTRETLLRMPPHGPEIVRLGFESTHPVDDALRAILNRSTATQPTHRYLQAWAFARALEGWRERAQNPEGGSVARLLDRLTRYGGLPVTRPEALKSIQAGGLEGRHVGELTGLVMQDLALSLEVLRRVNLARRREGGSGYSAILNVGKALALIGLKELSAAAQALRPWPGLLAPERVVSLRLAVARAHKAAEIAERLAPRGYDPDMLRLTALGQNLGRLLASYHMPDESEQIDRLQVAPEPTEAVPSPRGLSERQAAFAVLGCELDDLGVAALRAWGLGDEFAQLIRRPDPEQPVPHGSGDLDGLRLICAMANELVTLLAQRDLKRRRIGLELITRRYARTVGLSLEVVHMAVYPESAQASIQHTLA